METCKRVRTEVRPTSGGEQRLEIWLSGEIDLDWQDDLERLLLTFETGGATDAVVHCSDVTFLSSIGISALCRLQHLAQQRGGRLTLSQTCISVRRTLELAGVDTLITVA